MPVGIGHVTSQPYSEEALAKPGLIWEGSFLVNHSLANVNREIVLALLDTGVEVGCIPYETHKFSHEVEPRFARLQERFLKVPEEAAAHARHLFPPKFDPPIRGKYVLMQPWEFGSLPVEWKEGVENVWEVWAYSNYVKDIYVRAGVPDEKVHVIPLGVNPDQFYPGGEKFPLPTEKKFRFLFVGGLIGRKGADVLIKAYLAEFKREEDVCLVLKDFYYPSEITEQVTELAKRRDIPEIIHIQGDVLPGELPKFYSACSCYVQPYRGEGFGLPILEAMACGLPVIATRYGSALDFCNPGNSYLLPATVEVSVDKKINHLDTCDFPFWAEPDFNLLRRTMRWVFEHRVEALERGLAASCEARRSWNWDRTAEKIKERLLALSHIPSESLGENEVFEKFVSGNQRLSTSLTPAKGLTSSEIAARHNFIVPLHKAETILFLGGYSKKAAGEARHYLECCPAEVLPYACLLRGMIQALLGRQEEAERILAEVGEKFDSLSREEQVMIFRLAAMTWTEWGGARCSGMQGSTLRKVQEPIQKFLATPSPKKDPFHFSRVAEILCSHGLHREAEVILRSLPPEIFELPSCRYLLAKVYKGLGKTKDACATLEKITEDYPYYAPSWLLLSELSEDSAYSKAACLEAVKIYPFLEEIRLSAP